ncbi:nitrogenase iron-molybdenum cofactor biosynthesis protein NifN [Marinospirillum sp.]|uniref:nitrogenase iron-molybdenum cofactor biosynthesis protein NifN n=1 Tax=Marinospirillum sp. TaxID=2183934 RepID=UPI00287096F3|nr:nitrogenase iron-molybdenum cofactor biosynthesis protein NifN [Marinospirillum sp.]MDR9467077.1 nitrogenase iron-molybdenum cofactor biosynthesis protein NifN [Marinospirillum sp.]
MAEVIKSNKPMAVNPLKVSQPVGAILAFLGINKSLPMLHGSQGCSAFAKVFFVRHFREPIPLQTTAMDQATTVMGADDNVFKGLETVIEKRQPDLIGLPTTGLSETQGSDVQGLVKRFYHQHPEVTTPIIPVVAPDYSGGLETGYALAVEALLTHLVPEDTNQVGQKPQQINVLSPSMLTGADLEYLRELLESFGLQPVILPDLSDSLDGHLMEEDFIPVTTGGTPVEAFAGLGQAAHTLVIGRSLHKAADILKARTGVPDVRLDSLMGLQAMDQLILALQKTTGRAVPARVERQRSQLQDAQLDSHFMLGFSRFAIAADPDLLFAFSKLIAEIGGELVAAVSPHKADILAEVSAEQVVIGDLEDLEVLAEEKQAQVIISNSHAAQTALRLDLPLVRAGWPIYDRLGAQHQLWIGYPGSRNTLLALANQLLEQSPKHEIPARISIYAQADQTSEAAYAALKTG